MAEIFSKQENVIMHYKDNVPVAMTHVNGQTRMFTLGDPMGRKELEEFYETDKADGLQQ